MKSATDCFKRKQLTRDVLLAYDQNIVRHTQNISARRSEPLRWKYFQYLGSCSRKFTSTGYFRDADQLLSDLNDTLPSSTWIDPTATRSSSRLFVRYDLRKVAFWSATGSARRC